MNRILLTSTLLLAGAALTAGAYEMQLPQRKVCTAKAEAIARESIRTLRPQQEHTRAGVVKTEGETVDLTVSLQPSADGFYTPVAVIALRANEEADADVDQIDFSATLEIPAGTYDVVALFEAPLTGEESMRRPSFAFVIREDVEISVSGEMTISADEATVLTKFRQEMPDGQEMTFPPVIGFDDDGNPIFDEETEDYRVTALFMYNYLVSNEGGLLIFSNMTGFTLPDGTNSESTWDILCNPVSDDWTFAQSRFTMGCWDYPFFAVFSGRQTDGEMKATGNDFVNYLDIPTLHTPLADEMDELSSKYSGQILRVLCNGQQLGSDTFAGTLGGPGQEFPKWNIYSSQSSSADPVWITPFFFSYQCDANQTVDGQSVEGYVMAAPLFFDNGVPQFALKGGECYDWQSNLDSFPFLADGTGAETLAPGHPAFSYTLDQMRIPFASTAPILTTMGLDLSKVQEMPAPFALPSIWYLGSLGENRFSDWARLGIQVYFNGELAVECTGNDKLMNGVMGYYGSNPAAGEWLYKLDNANHRAETADGETIAGGNKAEIYLNTNNADYMPPTLRMLQTRNQDGIPTNIFSKAGDATLWLAASDYVMMADFETYEVWQEMRDATVTLEFAPYGTGWYEPLTIAEAPEMPTINSLGRIYTANLGEIARSSETGWFDLRVTVTDEAGNYQRQEISPALRIDELTGIAAVSGEREDIRVEGRDIVAPEDARVYTTAGIETRRTSLMPGVYIVSTPRSSRRVIIR